MNYISIQSSKDELGTKGAQIRRKKLISDYDKFSD